MDKLNALFWSPKSDTYARRIWLLFFAIVAVLAFFQPAQRNITHHYSRAAFNWWKSENMYSLQGKGFLYFPQSVPGIGAGSILVFILAIGYYITPELVGGTQGVFISNRIAFHISSSLNWGLAAALGTILLSLVLLLYYVYDKIVGIDNVKLG